MRRGVRCEADVQLIGARGRRRPREVRSFADAQPGELSIWATPSQHATIRATLMEMEREGERVFDSVQLKRLDHSPYSLRINLIEPLPRRINHLEFVMTVFVVDSFVKNFIFISS